MKKNKNGFLIIFIGFLFIILFMSSFNISAENFHSDCSNKYIKSTDPTYFPNKGTRDQISSPWPMFRGNPQHTGLSPYNTSGNQGKLVWKYLTGNIGWSSPAIDGNGNIFIGSMDYYLYGINHNGTLKWKFKFGKRFIRSSPAIDSNGNIYVGSEDSNLYAIKPDGTLKWKFKTGDEIYSSPVIGDNGQIIVGSSDFKLYAIDAAGTQKWNYSTTGKIESTPAVGTDGTIYFASGYPEEYLYAIDSNGKLKWKYKTGFIIRSSPAIGNTGTIYVGSNNNLYALYPNGTKKWKFATDDDIESSPAIDSNGIVYVGSNDKYLYAINPDGTKKWNFKTESFIYSPPAIGADGTIFIGSGKFLYAINSDGTEKWKYETGGNTLSSPAIDAEGIIYIGSQDDYLHAIGKFPPSPPNNLNVTFGDSYINLFWEPSENDGGSTIIKYNIFKSTNFGDEIFLTSLDSSATSYNDTAVTNGLTYYYYITSENEFGNSVTSNRVNATPRTLPTSPQNLQAITGNNYINLTWEIPNDNGGAEIIEYKIFKGENSEDQIYYSSTNGITLFYNDTSVENGQVYNYSVKAVNDVGESLASNEISIIPKTLPTSPRNLQRIIGDSLIDLTWEIPNDNGGAEIIKYNIYKGTNQNNEIYLSNIDESKTSFRDTNVINGETYYYFITAVNSVGESAPSNEIYGTPIGKPSEPREFTAIIKDDKVMLNWSVPEDDGGTEISNYKIYRGTKFREEEFYISIDAKETTFQDGDIKPGTKYFYYITAENEVGEGKSGNNVEIIIPEDNDYSENYNFLVSLSVIIIVIIIILTIFLIIRKRKKSKKQDYNIVSNRPATVIKDAQLKPITQAQTPYIQNQLLLQQTQQQSPTQQYLPPGPDNLNQQQTLPKYLEQSSNNQRNIPK